MIGKIMSEASHSIIGMLSAKPSSMETKTANIEFSSLLLPGEDRARPSLDGAGAETAEDKGDAQFLDQLVGSEDQPVLPVNDRDIIKADIIKAMVTKLAADKNEGDNKLPSDAPVSLPSASEIGRFNSVALSNSDLSVKAGLEQASIDVDETAVDQPQQKLADVAKVASIPLTSVDRPAASGDATTTIDGRKAPAAADKQMPLAPSSPVADDLNLSPTENRAAVESKSLVALNPLVEGRPLADGKAVLERGAKVELSSSSTNDTNSAPSDINIPKRNPAEIMAHASLAGNPVAAKAVVDSGMPNPSKTNGLSGTTQPDIEPGQKITDALDLRAANKSKVEDAISRQVSKSETDEAPFVADKPIKSETKTSFAETDSRPAASHLDRNIELSAPVHSLPISGATNVTQKTVNFDWHAPQFAERFASELSDLTATGDLKKFEINPRNMGRMEVSFVAKGASEILQIEAENEAAREVIVQHSQAIQDILKAQGRSDLTLRVDVRENMFSSSGNDSMNFAQQDRNDAQDERSNPSQNYGQSTPIEGQVDPQKPSDNSRYA